ARLAPGDFVSTTAGIASGAQSAKEARARLGLDRPILAQYGDWLAGAARLDFGRSFLYDTPVADLVRERAANTAILALPALRAAPFIRLPLGVLTGSRRGGFVPGLIRSASLVLISLPPLLTSLLFVVVAARTGWFPIGGMRSPSVDGSDFADLLWHLAVPAAA